MTRSFADLNLAHPPPATPCERFPAERYSTSFALAPQQAAIGIPGNTALSMRRSLQRVRRLKHALAVGLFGPISPNFLLENSIGQI